MRVDIVIFDGVDELDAIGPLEVFRSAHLRGADLETKLVTLREVSHVTAGYGLRFEPDQPYRAGEADVVIVPGGGWALQRDVGVYGELQRHSFDEVLVDAHARGTLLAGVCTGVLLLAQAGLLVGRRAATHHRAREELTRLGATVLTDRVVDDGDIVTCGGVTSGLDLALWLLEREVSADIADKVAAGMEYVATRPERPA